MTRVVSVTSMAVERDSRTFKMAASIARFGFESIVVEGERSTLLPDELPFRLISPAPDPPAQVESPPAAGTASPAPRGRISNVIQIQFAKRTAGLKTVRYTARTYYDDYRTRNELAAGLLPEADVYWLHSFFQVPAVYRRARRTKARFLYDTPDAYWEPGQTAPVNRTARNVMRVFERIERFAVRRAESFTTVSDGVADLMERRFGRRPLVIRNCHDGRLDQEPARGIREVTGVAPGDFLLAMSGNLKDGHTVESALDALLELPDRVHLAFVGRGHDASAPLVAEQGLEGRVHLLPPVAPTEIVGFIADADASPILYRAATSNYEHSLPNGFFHAIAAGLPVLWPPLAEMSALGRRLEFGIEVDVTSPSLIAEAVTRLMDDPDLLARCAANAVSAREELSWEHEERRLAEILGTPGPDTGK